MATTYTIRATGTPGGPGGRDYVLGSAFLIVHTGEERLFGAELRLTGSAVGRVEEELGLERSERGANPNFKLQEAILLAGLERLCEGLRTGELPPDPLDDPFVIEFHSGNVDVVIRAGRTKRCGYQRKNGREMLCLAAAADDPGAIGKDGFRVIARTAPRICDECDLPDDRILCRHLLNPRVRYDHDLVGRVLKDAECNLGREEVGRLNGVACRAAMNRCWEIIVERESPTLPVERRTPRALVEALDFFDATWRLVFGKTHRIFQCRSAATIARLVEPCETAEEFESRMSALVDVLDQLAVDDRLMAAGIPKEELRQLKSLQRLERSLEPQIPPERFARVSNAIAHLRALVAVRVSLQHRGANMAVAFGKAGLSMPPRWREDWETARALAAEAITTIREEVAVLKP